MRMPAPPSPARMAWCLRQLPAEAGVVAEVATPEQVEVASSALSMDALAATVTPVTLARWT